MPTIKRLVSSCSIDLNAKLLSDSSISQSHSKWQFKSTNHNFGFNHHRNSVQAHGAEWPDIIDMQELKSY